MNKSNVLFGTGKIIPGRERSFVSSISLNKKNAAQLSIKEVTSPEEAALFRNFPDQIHRSNPKYIKPLDKDIEAVFDKKQNKFFLHGRCSRWLLYDENDNVIGRVAVFINDEYVQAQPTGGFGFFDCIDSKPAAHFMFDHCKKWLQERGMEAMDGPINFGERANWWGLVVEGFHAPLYGMNYNPPYYQQLFESYGFHVYFYQLCFGRAIKAPLPDKFYRIKDRVSADAQFEAIPISKNNIDQFARDFARIYNRSWETHGEGKQMEESQAVKLFRKMKAVIDEKVVWFIYHRQQPVACWLNLPDLNVYFRSLDGKFGLWEIIRFLILRKTRPNRKLIGLLFGIVPEFQNKGIDAFMIVKALETINDKTQYSDYEMQWIGDFNPKMINIARNMGAECMRRLATYRYLFDQSKPFVRHPNLSV